MSYAPPPPPPADTLIGQQVRALWACVSDADFAALADQIRAGMAPGGDFESAARHVVVCANDNCGYAEEAWRNRMMNRLGASDYKGLSDRQVARREAGMARAKYVPARRRRLFWWLP
jgi:hypothetical protein